MLLASLKMRAQEVQQLEAALEEERKKSDDVEPANRCTICDKRRINARMLLSLQTTQSVSDIRLFHILCSLSCLPC
jgi:hypothetical protein